MKSIVFFIGLCVSVDALHLRPVLAQVKGSNQTKGLDIYASHNDSPPATKLLAAAAPAPSQDACAAANCPRDVCPDGASRRKVGDDCCSCGEGAEAAGAAPSPAALTKHHHATWECGDDSIPIDRNGCDSAVWCMCPKAGGTYPVQNDGGPIEVLGGQYRKDVLPKFPVAQKMAGAQKTQFETVMGKALPKWEERCRAQWQPSCDQWTEIIRPMVDEQRRTGAACISRSMCGAAFGAMSITWDKEWGMYVPSKDSNAQDPNEILSRSAHSYDTWVKSWQEYGPIAYGIPKKLEERFPNMPKLKDLPVVQAVASANGMQIGKPWDNLRTWQGKTQGQVKSAVQKRWENQQQWAQATGTKAAWQTAKNNVQKVKNGIPLGNHWN